MDHNIIHISKGCIKCNNVRFIMIQTAAHVYANNKLMIVCIRYVSRFSVVVVARALLLIIQFYIYYIVMFVHAQ